MEVAHFYHAWCNGAWHDPVREHLAALRESDFPSPVHLGVVGGPNERGKCIAAFGPTVKVVAEERYGFEQVTLMQLRHYAHYHDGAVMYAHTKTEPEWRRLMTDHIVRDWRTYLAKLDDYDLAGHWWRMEPDMHFSGNFWMATCAYIRTLPPVRNTNRHDAEKWLSLSDPRVE
jgi:hypothetical protein